MSKRFRQWTILALAAKLHLPRRHTTVKASFAKRPSTLISSRRDQGVDVTGTAVVTRWSEGPAPPLFDEHRPRRGIAGRVYAIVVFTEENGLVNDYGANAYLEACATSIADALAAAATGGNGSS